jgi:glycosyltransferase involved in cell wall biosynthesis
LRDRYVAWGLPAEKMVVLENGQPRNSGIAETESPDNGRERRFVVLGQLSRLKGTLVLLEAVRLLPDAVRKKIKIEIHGSVQYADDEFKTQLATGLKGIEDTVRLHGPYMREHVDGILRRNGWLIVPSIWWENSPIVIQEAMAAGRPVICSNIGGMAEKVADGVTGFHFRVNNPADLATRIEWCASQPEFWRDMCAGFPQPPAIEETVDKLLMLYAKIDQHATSEHAAELLSD